MDTFNFYYVIQIKRKTDGTFSNSVKTMYTEAEAFHFFYAVLSSYAYDQAYDYVACKVFDVWGRELKSEVVDLRVAPAPAPAPEPELEPEMEPELEPGTGEGSGT